MGTKKKKKKKKAITTTKNNVKEYFKVLTYVIVVFLWHLLKFGSTLLDNTT